MLTFIGPAKRLDDVDLPRLGAEIGVGEDELHAIIDVETAGGPSDAKGRLRMLFEPHVFWRNLTGAKRDRAAAEGLAYPTWRPGYPADSYPRLAAAMAIDETAALRAASWGLGQILGENHKMVGFATPQAMIGAFCADEENHLAAMIRFIKAAGIAEDLRAHRWEAVARRYNGPKYAVHNYHGRLAARFAFWQRIKDTPWSPDAPTVPAPKTSGAVITTVAVGAGGAAAAAGGSTWSIALAIGGVVLLALLAFVAFITLREIQRRRIAAMPSPSLPAEPPPKRRRQPTRKAKPHAKAPAVRKAPARRAPVRVRRPAASARRAGRSA